MKPTGTLKIFIMLHLKHPFGVRTVRKVIHTEYGLTYEEAKKTFAEFQSANPNLPYAGANWQPLPEELR